MSVSVTTRVHNFNAGPAILPKPVLEQVQAELLDYKGTGISILEASHRSKEYEHINSEAQARLKGLLGLGDEYSVMFLGGGASQQFAMVPINFLQPGRTADYVVTGTWTEKALEEASKIGQTRVAASTKEGGYRRVPRQEEISLSPEPAYVHICSNETVVGTQWHYWPEVGDAPLVADMSSDFLSGPVDAQRFALIYAGAQKNVGPAGVTVVAARTDWLEEAPKNLPTMLRYATFAKNKSLYNTPPVFGVYVLNLVLGWIQDLGLDALRARNEKKAGIVYGAIDNSEGFYQGHVEKDSRSLMNATFRLPSEVLEKEFVRESLSEGFVGLAGHRSVGGIRVSMYNAMEVEGCEALAAFMQEFARRHG